MWRCRGAFSLMPYGNFSAELLMEMAITSMTCIACMLLLVGPSAATSLTPQCSDPPLGVDYTGIKYYNGRVTCGNLLLEADIGGTHPWIPPNVTFAHASDDALYTLMYIDPYVNVPNNGSWPTCGSACAGTKAPARHWVVGNIRGKVNGSLGGKFTYVQSLVCAWVCLHQMLQNGDLAGSSTVSAFKGPSPPYGSHPYGRYHCAYLVF